MSKINLQDQIRAVYDLNKDIHNAIIQKASFSDRGKMRWIPQVIVMEMNDDHITLKLEFRSNYYIDLYDDGTASGHEMNVGNLKFTGCEDCQLFNTISDLGIEEYLDCLESVTAKETK